MLLVNKYLMLYDFKHGYEMNTSFTWLVMDTNFLVFCPIGLRVTIPSITAVKTWLENRELGEPLRR